MANVKLSPEELRMVTDADLILTKNRIIQKVYELFGEVAAVMQDDAVVLPPSFTAIAPKISRGENYLGLPWVMLDYPRIFSKTDVFAVRSFFWWGHYFSISLQLQGHYQQHFVPALSRQLPAGDWYINTAGDPWQHHIGETNHDRLTLSLLQAQRPFIKLSKKIPLSEWDNGFDFYRDNFRNLLQCLGT